MKSEFRRKKNFINTMKSKKTERELKLRNKADFVKLLFFKFERSYF